MAQRAHRRPKEDLHIWSPNVSDRSASIRGIVLHNTESHDYPGKADLEGVGSWFKNPSSQVSAHLVVDSEGYTLRCVADSKKAWHCMNYNSESLGIEQVGWSGRGRAFWTRNGRKQIKKVAKHIAYWSITYDIPIQRAHTRDGHFVTKGITTHRALGSAGGNHDDPGANYPFKTVLRLAAWYKKHGWT